MSFIRNVATLITGTTVAQVIPIAISPILTRLYTPDDFGLLALYMSVVGLVAVVSTLRYELAIVQPQHDNDAKAIVLLSALLLGIISFLCLLFAIFYNIFELDFFNNKEIGVLLYLMPLSVFCIGGFNIINYWLLRQDAYKKMSLGKMIQGGSGGIFQLFFVFFKSYGLMIGQVLGQFIALCYMLWLSRSDLKSLHSIDRKVMIKNLKQYIDMPKYSTFGALMDNMSSNLPIFILNYFFNNFIVGIFSFTSRILSAPSALVSAAVSQAVYKKVNDMNGKEEGNISIFILKISFGLFVLFFPFAICIWFFGEKIFAFIFGDEWIQAGSYARIIIFAIMIKFIVSPLSVVLAIQKNIRLGLIWQFLHVTTLFFVLLYFSQSDIYVFLWAFALNEIILYIIYFIFILIGARNLRTF